MHIPSGNFYFPYILFSIESPAPRTVTLHLKLLINTQMKEGRKEERLKEVWAKLRNTKGGILKYLWQCTNLITISGGNLVTIRIEKSFQFSSVTQSCPTLCNPMNCSTPGLPVHHQLPESTQTHVHLVGDAIQPSNPLSSPSPPALNLS